MTESHKTYGIVKYEMPKFTFYRGVWVMYADVARKKVRKASNCLLAG